MDSEILRQYLEFYQDLGIKTLYKQPAPEAAESEASRNETAPAGFPLPTLEPAGDTLLRILEDLGDCRRCRLHEGRNKIVFGVGDERAPLVFVGEGPGADEDDQGFP